MNPTEEEYRDRLEILNRHIDQNNLQRLCENASRQTTNSKKLIWLQNAANYLVKAVDDAQVAACTPTGGLRARSGYSHCCNIAVSISEVEAVALSKATTKAFIKTPANSAIIQEDEASASESLRPKGRSF